MGTNRAFYAVYVLFDPDTREARYVGKTTNGRYRINRHVAAARKKEALGAPFGVRSERWIRKLIRADKVPGCAYLEICEHDRAALGECERGWIRYFTDLGANLTNVTAGGDGGGGPVSDAHRERLRSSNRVAWADPELRSRHAKRMLEMYSNPEYRERHALAIRNGRRGVRSAPVTWGDKISKALKGRVFSQEHCERISSSKKGKPAPPGKMAKLHEARRKTGRVLRDEAKALLLDAAREIAGPATRREIMIRAGLKNRRACRDAFRALIASGEVFETGRATRFPMVAART